MTMRDAMCDAMSSPPGTAAMAGFAVLSMASTGVLSSIGLMAMIHLARAGKTSMATVSPAAPVFVAAAFFPRGLA